MFVSLGEWLTTALGSAIAINVSATALQPTPGGPWLEHVKVPSAIRYKWEKTSTNMHPVAGVALEGGAKTSLNCLSYISTHLFLILNQGISFRAASISARGF